MRGRQEINQTECVSFLIYDTDVEWENSVLMIRAMLTHF